MKTARQYLVVTACSIGLTWFFAQHLAQVAPAQTPEPTSAVDAESQEKERAEFSRYRSWSRTSSEAVPASPRQYTLCAPYRSPQETAKHEGGYVAVYVNATGHESFAKGKSVAFPEGTVIVKEKLAKKDDKQAEELGIMVKRKKGFDPEAGDWQFLFVDFGNRLVSSHRELSNCRSCHRSKADSDYVFAKRALTDLPQK